jgi:hypothetical protein
VYCKLLGSFSSLSLLIGVWARRQKLAFEREWMLVSANIRSLHLSFLPLLATKEVICFCGVSMMDVQSRLKDRSAACVALFECRKDADHIWTPGHVEI